MKVGIISTGSMGSTLGKLCQDNGHEIYWASDGRSERSRNNAEKLGFTDVVTHDKLAEICQVVFCVVSGEGNALAIAEQFGRNGYRGIYVDANGFSTQETDTMLYRTAYKYRLKLTEMGIRGWTIYDEQIPRPETAKMFISSPEAEAVKDLLDNPNWVFTVNDEVRPKQTIREFNAGLRQ
jgi:glycerol-3-phosphate dehydrogenase